MIYNLETDQPAAPATCAVFGYLTDITGAPIVGAKVTIELILGKKAQYKEATDHIVGAAKKNITTNSEGLFEIDLIRSSAFEGEGKYKLTASGTGFKIKNNGGTTILAEFSVPDVVECNITDLIVGV